MGKIIDLPTREVPATWTIEVGGCEDYFHCRYIGEDKSIMGAHWRVYIQAATMDSLRSLLKKAEAELAKNKAAMRTRKRLTAWTKGEQALKGQKRTTRGRANTEGGKCEKGLKTPISPLSISRERERRKCNFQYSAATQMRR